MKADLMQSRSRHQRGQALHEFHRCHHMVAGAFAPRRLELQYDVPVGANPQALNDRFRKIAMSALGQKTTSM